MVIFSVTSVFLSHIVVLAIGRTDSIFIKIVLNVVMGTMIWSRIEVSLNDRRFYLILEGKVVSVGSKYLVKIGFG